MRKNICHTKLLLLILLFWGGLDSAEVNAQTQEPRWHSFEEALALADSSDRPVLVDVWAPWCGWCRKMKKEVYPELDPGLTDRFIITRLNRDNNDKMYQYRGEKLTPLRLAQKLGVENVPAIVFLAPGGEYLLHISGFIKAEELQPVLEYVSTGAYQHQTFQKFVNQTGL